MRDGQCAVRVDLERLHRVVQGAVPVLEIKGVGELAVRGLFGAAEEGPELQPYELGDQRRPCTAERRQLRGEGLDDLVELDLIGLGQRAEETDPVGVRLPTGVQGRAQPLGRLPSDLLLPHAPRLGGPTDKKNWCTNPVDNPTCTRFWPMELTHRVKRM